LPVTPTISAPTSAELEDLRKEIASLKSRVNTLELENEKLSDDLLLSQEQTAMVTNKENTLLINLDTT
jgi:regulator of replication initiation timing